MIGFSTPFDASSVDFLESLDVPCYKIASFEVVDIPLIRRVAATGKPMIASVGMATTDEISDLLQAARGGGCEDIVLLKCTSSYPASPQHTNLRTIDDMRRRFDVPVGLSDHTMGIGAALAAVALGAVMIEKHFTMRRADGGPDSAFSLEPPELRVLVDESLRGWEALGTVSYERTGPEREAVRFRRSLYITRDLKAGDVLDETNVRAIRPAGGLPPKYFDLVVGRAVIREVRRGTPVSWELLD
jgi:N-acetylneuraminate synthase